MKHLQETLPEGHQMADYGDRLCVDHIIAVKYFRYEKPEDLQFQLCWALPNLRIVTHEENMKKGDKVPENWKEILIKLRDFVLEMTKQNCDDYLVKFFKDYQAGIYEQMNSEQLNYDFTRN